MAQGGLTDFAGDSEKFVSRLVADTEQFINKLVERGTIAEQDGRALINNMVEARTSQVKGGVKSVGEGADKRIEAVLTRMNIPSRNDINKLSGKISALAEKVDQLL